MIYSPCWRPHSNKKLKEIVYIGSCLCQGKSFTVLHKNKIITLCSMSSIPCTFAP
jgi:hypothetical protein